MYESSPKVTKSINELSDCVIENVDGVMKFEFSKSMYPKEWNLISCGRNQMLNLWNWKTGEHVAEIEDAHDGMILSIIEYKKDFYATGSVDTKIRLWHGFNGGLDYEGELNGHRRDVNCISNLGGKILVSGSDDHDLRVWDSEDFECVCIFDEHLNDIRDVKALDSRTVASASYDKTVRIFDIGKEIQKAVLRRHISRVRCLEVVREHEIIFSGSYGRRVIVWDYVNEKKIHEMKENNWINSLHFFQPKKWLITGDDQGKLGWWDIRKMQKAFRYDSIHENFVTSIVTIMKGLVDEPINRIATCSTDGKICVVDVNTGKVIKKMEENGWIFGLLNHERSFPDELLLLTDIIERKEYLHDKFSNFEIRILKKGKIGKYRSIRMNKMFIFLMK